VPVGIAVSSDDVTVRISGEAGETYPATVRRPNISGLDPARPGSARRDPVDFRPERGPVDLQKSEGTIGGSHQASQRFA
jgi:hypothetical protein